MYKEASKQRLRILTSRGNLSIEQLWDLDLKTLDETAVALEKAYNESGKKSFLVKRSSKDKEIKLKLDIVLDILESKVEESSMALEAKEVKEHNNKIDALIAEKLDDELKSKSVKDLQRMRK